MRGTFTVIKADGSSATQPVSTTPDYKMIKHGLDQGTLQLVPLFDRYHDERCVAFCDEDGRHKGLPHNAIATALWHACIRAGGREPADVLTTPDVVGLVGPIVMISGDEELLRSL